MTAPTLKDDLLRHLVYSLGTDPDAASAHDWRAALSLSIRDRMAERRLASARAANRAGAKRVYYLSMEFLVGRLLEDAIENLGLVDQVREAFEQLGGAPEGLRLSELLHEEPDAALGNGGLGRLAACFMESLATLGCPAFGYGIRYEHGLFRQSFDAGRQIESPETWLTAQKQVWEWERRDRRFAIGFGGETKLVGGKSVWTPAETVMAAAFDMPVIGWKGDWANTLRLWSAQAVEPFDLHRFDAGDYLGATTGEALARTISRVLYPNDSTEDGKVLRLKQEFFFTAASLRDVLRRFELECGDLKDLPKRAAIQLNDTHPAIAGPELVRLLHDEKGMPLDAAIATARGVLSYTNHTLLPEALESWPEGLMRSLLPRHMELIERIDAAHAAEKPGRKVKLVAEGEAKMGELAFVMAHKVNGVSALHTELMKQTVFKELHRLHPDRILNQTNGVTPRRWVHSCNRRLGELITSAIGEGWQADLERLSELEPHLNDAGFMADYAAAKTANKTALVDWAQAEHGVALDPEAMFDVQIKRIHEYKRQHLNILETIALWQAIKSSPNAAWTPRVKIFGGKAAPGYFFAKEIIRLINDVATVLNADPVTSKYLKVAYFPNYNVTMAERLIPAADLSEQISTAGKEASGTGNMKFALNGAPTIGTLDGANVEIRELVGEEEFFLFGMTAEEAEARRTIKGHAAQAIAADMRLKTAIDAISKGAFSGGDPARYAGVVANLREHDYFLVCSDFTAYWDAQRRVDAAYLDAARWTLMAARNTARSGWFSSDRTIRGYMQDIWGAKSLPAPEAAPLQTAKPVIG